MPRNLGRKRRNNDHIPIDLKRKKGAKRNSNAIAKVGPLSREGNVGTSMDNSSVSLREKMMEKLKGAHFRYLNEMLYKSTTEEAESIFQEDPDAAQVYHDGFKLQSSRWPINPLDLIIADIKQLPEHLKVADVGCGEARLAADVKQPVYSFDLCQFNDAVTVANMTELPLTDSSTDICVFCLALMCTNVADCLQEANRILKTGGLLKIAEITSRFVSVKNFRRSVEKLGFTFIRKVSPNDMFVLLDFKKTKNSSAKGHFPGLYLKPCLYKKR